MRARLLLTAGLTATLLAGCESIPPMPAAPVWTRVLWNQNCTGTASCEVTINPHLMQWAPEKVFTDRGKPLHFKVRNNVAKFADPGIVFKTKDGIAKFPCARQNDHFVKCDNNGDAGASYGYTIRLVRPDGTVAEYDPFVVNR